MIALLLRDTIWVCAAFCWYKLGPVQGGRRGGAVATGGGKAEVAGAVEAADYRHGGSCGNGGWHGARMTAVAAVWPVWWSCGNGGRQSGRMAVVAAVWRARWSCGNVGRQIKGGRHRSGCRLPARWKLR